MVVVSLQPVFHFMNRAGIATSTRRVARKTWGERLPEGDRAELVRELYRLENRDRCEPLRVAGYGRDHLSGYQPAGLRFRGGRRDFPEARVKSCNDPATIAWLEQVVHILPVCPRPDGYDPLIIQNLLPEWIARLGRAGHDCFNAILHRDARRWARP